MANKNKPKTGSKRDIANRQMRQTEKQAKHLRKIENRTQSRLDKQQRFDTSRRNINYQKSKMKAGMYDDPIANRIRASGQAAAATIGSATGGSAVNIHAANNTSPVQSAIDQWNKLIDGNPDKQAGDTGADNPSNNPSNNPGSALGG